MLLHALSCLAAVCWSPSSFSISFPNGYLEEGITMSLYLCVLTWPSMWSASPVMANKAWFCTGLTTLWNHTSVSIHRSLPARHTGLGVGFFFRDPQKVFSRTEKQKPRRLFPLHSISQEAGLRGVHLILRLQSQNFRPCGLKAEKSQTSL